MIMYGIKTTCDFRKDCIHRDSTVCNACSRNNLQKQDYFEQDSEVVKDRLTEIINSRFSFVKQN